MGSQAGPGRGSLDTGLAEPRCESSALSKSSPDLTQGQPAQRSARGAARKRPVHRRIPRLLAQHHAAPKCRAAIVRYSHGQDHEQISVGSLGTVFVKRTADLATRGEYQMRLKCVLAGPRTGNQGFPGRWTLPCPAAVLLPAAINPGASFAVVGA